MRRFPEELGKLGFVFNFITYGGHQIDGLAGEEFATALKQDGMLALARLQRKFRLVESPYRTPQTLVGGPRLDGALMSASGRTAATKAMGKGSTQFQHLVQTEVPPKLLGEWLDLWRDALPAAAELAGRAAARTRAGSELLELSLFGRGRRARGERHLRQRPRSARPQHPFGPRPEHLRRELRKKRLMTLVQLFLIHRYKAVVRPLRDPTEDNQYQAGKMKNHGIFSDVRNEVGQIIVAEVRKERIAELLESDRKALMRLIDKTGPPPS